MSVYMSLRVRRGDGLGRRFLCRISATLTYDALNMSMGELQKIYLDAAVKYYPVVAQALFCRRDSAILVDHHRQDAAGYRPGHGSNPGSRVGHS